MAAYKLNTKTKEITLEKSTVLEAAEKDVIEMYIKAGYTVRWKSEKRAAAAKKRAKANGGVGKKKAEAETK